MFTPYDILLLGAVTALGTFAAYIKDPQVKAGMGTIPIPFSCAWLAVGAPVDTSNALGQFLILAYVHIVRVLHDRYRAPILPAIAVGIATYAGMGALLYKTIPHSETAFWIANVLSVLTGLWLFRTQDYSVGVSYRTPLPAPLKAGAIATVLLFLITIKKSLGGFATFFPMMGSVTSYESRHSLRDQCRQMTLFMIAGPGLLIPMRYTQVFLGWSKWSVLLTGVIVYMAIYWPLNLAVKRRIALHLAIAKL